MKNEKVIKEWIYRNNQKFRKLANGKVQAYYVKEKKWIDMERKPIYTRWGTTGATYVRKTTRGE